MHALNADVLTYVPLACATLLAVTATNMHFTCDVVTNAREYRINVLAELHDFAAEFMADDDRAVAIDGAAIEHLVAHAWARCDLIDALVRAADGRGLDANLYVAMAHARLRLILDKLQSVFIEAQFLECLHLLSWKFNSNAKSSPAIGASATCPLIISRSLTRG
jgi:hypothetical protein